MKEKTFGKESKTLFPNFKTATNVENKGSLQIDEIENNENQNQSEKTELSPETETKFFKDKERKWNYKEWQIILRRNKNTNFPIFIFVNDVESDIFLQNNQLESNENQNHREIIHRCWIFIRNWYPENCYTSL